MKKLLIISSIIFSIFLLALGAYYFLLKTNEKSVSGRKVSVTDFFPFGKNGNIGQPEPKEEILDQTEEINDSFKERLRLISKDPVSGFTFVENGDGLYIRYVEKGTGHIYDVSTFSDKKNKISNKTILNTQKVLFTNKGNSFIAQYLNDNSFVENSFVNITKKENDDRLDIKKLDPSIESVSVGQNNGNIIYFSIKNDDGYLFLSKSPKHENIQIWTDKLKQIIPEYINDKTFIITTKSDWETVGYSYILDTNNKIKKILGPTYGLTVKPDSFGENLVFNRTSPTYIFYSYNIKKESFLILSPSTFPEKCVFSLKNSRYMYCAVPKKNISQKSISNWYYGIEGFSDEIWKYDVVNGVSQMLVDLDSITGIVMDINEISIDKDENILLLKNKADGGSLWSFNINP